MHWFLSQLHSSLVCVTQSTDGRSAHHQTLDLPRVFTPDDAVHVLRSLGLTGMTECALRTRAYRKQVPFHLNGRRITFTLGDLQEIAEGRACRPQPPDFGSETTHHATARPHHRSSVRSAETRSGAWRARRRGDLGPAAHSGADR